MFSNYQWVGFIPLIVVVLGLVWINLRATPWDNLSDAEREELEDELKLW